MRHKMVKISIMAALVAGLPLVAMAQDASSLSDDASGTITTQQIDNLNGRIAVLEAELKIAKLKASIKKANSTRVSSTGITGSPSPISMQNSPMGGYAGFGAFHKGESMPRVESVMGTHGRLSAMVSMPDGGQRIVKPGSHLSNGMIVQDVTPSGVEVNGKKGIQWLSFMNGNSDESASKDSSPSTPFSNAISPPPFTPPTNMANLPTPPSMNLASQSGPSPYAGMTGGH